ncbi:integrase/recombinase [Vagococcus vulneris]|uniref:Integrase/recombinase n=1 Tax=Vagococcus vulneris TaxID=1977869 RepID=A0A430A132_9ENTE|nr:integrase/recombinase [Vagococcus vulneris]
MEKLEDLLEEMMFNDKARGLLAKTIKKHQKLLNLFFKELNSDGVYKVKDITPKDIRKFLIKKLEEGSSETYVNNHLRSIRAFFRYCVDEEYLEYDKNLCLRVKWVKERQVVVQTFNDEEIKEMLAVAKKLTFFNGFYYGKMKNTAKIAPKSINPVKEIPGNKRISNTADS